MRIFRVGERVAKTKGDYTFEGIIVAIFDKRDGARRCVVEDDRGLLFIFAPHQLDPVVLEVPK